MGAMVKGAIVVGKALGVAAAKAAQSPTAVSAAKAAATGAKVAIGVGKIALGVLGAAIFEAVFGWGIEP